MSQRERTNDQEDRPCAEPPAGAGLSAARDAGAGFLAAGDAAIERALSGDSAAFLAANRQQGGE